MQVVSYTHVGMRRLNNEDAVGFEKNRSEQALCILCDGVGGHKSGEVASHTTVNFLKERWKDTENMTEETTVSWLNETIQRANGHVFDYSGRFPDLKGMSTTLVCAVIIGNQLLIAHVGDSRCYVYRSPEFKQVTVDHSLVNDLVELGELTREEAAHHPMKNIITRAIGSRERVDIEITQLTVHDRDIIVLCSDGLSDMVPDNVLLQEFQTWKTLEERAKSLVQLANNAGGKDNISVVLTQYKEKGEAI